MNTDISHNEIENACENESCDARAECTAMPIEVVSPVSDPKLLEGKYSEGFVDALARAITRQIEKLTSTEGLAVSGARLTLVFAPESYMEHTSESVTYRRLLLSYGQGAPRDLWVKWTRLDSDGEAYSVSDTPEDGTILFEIGEDVPQKIREKEYRFLAKTSPDKYRNAMGRRNVTEWRELIKRAVKCGDLTRVEKVVELSEETAELSERLAAVLGINDTARSTSVEAERAPQNDDIAELARTALGYDEPTGEEDEPCEVRFDDEVIEDEPVCESAKDEDIFETADESEAEEEAEEIEDAVDTEEDEPEAVATLAVPDDPTDEEYETVEEGPLSEAECEPEECAAAGAAPDTERLEASIRAELEAKIRLEYESRARMQAEEEAARLRRAAEELRLENERLRETSRLEREARESERAAEEERLRAELELKLRQESRERERLAEAAREALYERERLEEERAREAERRAMEARAEAEARARAEEAARIERERLAEAERIRREAEERASAPAEKKYSYTKKTVLLLFRRSVDPNVTSRIYEIIKATIDYYGKGDVYIRIKASVPDTTTVRLDFTEIPVEELELLTNIIKVLGNSGLGIAKAKIQ